MKISYSNSIMKLFGFLLLVVGFFMFCFVGFFFEIKYKDTEGWRSGTQEGIKKKTKFEDRKKKEWWQSKYNEKN